MSIVSRIQEYILTDDDDQSERLKNDYQHATKQEQEAIDNALICICGYSLATVIEEARDDE